MKSYLIAKSNIKKNISSTIGLLVLIAIASVFLYISASVLFYIGDFIDSKKESMNGADITLITSQSIKDDLLDFTRKKEGVEKADFQPALVYQSLKLTNISKNKEETLPALIVNQEVQCEFSTVYFSEHKSTPMDPDSIVLPLYLKEVSGYEIGDQIELNIHNYRYTFTVYGFLEDVMFANSMNSYYIRFSIQSERFDQMRAESHLAERKDLIHLKLTEPDLDGTYEENLLREAGQKALIDVKEVSSYGYERMKIGLSQTMNIYMVLLMVFALIIIVVAMVIIRFSIITHMEQNMKNIASLQSVGYTNRQIRTSFLAQFTMIAATGYFIGMIFAMLFNRIVNALVSYSIALRWRAGLSVMPAVFSMSVIVFLVIIITGQTTARINKITTVAALRDGVEDYSFKRNYLPLMSSPFSLNHTIAIKNILHNRKQNVTMGIISLLISFMLVFTITIYYNFTGESTTFYQLIGIERNEVTIICSPEESNQVREFSASIESTSKVIPFEYLTMSLIRNERQCTQDVTICEDYSKLELNTIVKGRAPIYSNEIVLSNIISKKLNAEIGDVITVKYLDKEAEYLVVGLAQHTYHLGMSASITTEGMKQLNAEYVPSRFNIYLQKKGEDLKYIEKVEQALSDYQVQIIHMSKSIDDMLHTTYQAIELLVLVCIIMTVVIIVLTLYLLIKVKLIKDRKLIGIHKSIGYTTWQLMYHIIFSFGMVVLIGTLIGGTLGFFLMDPICVLMFSIAGITNVSLQIPIHLVLPSFACLILLSVLVAVLCSLRIRKISPRELFANM